MSKKVFLFSALATSLVLTACNDPKEANKEDLGKAIQEYLTTLQPAYCIKYPKSNTGNPTLGKSQEWDIFYIPDNSSEDTKVEQKLEYLTGKGLLTKKTYTNSIDSNIVTYIYSPSEELQKNLVEGWKDYQICLATKFELKNIGMFTEPADLLGVKTTKVNYTLEAKWPSWATPSEFFELFKDDLIQAENKIKDEQQISLILTNEGWKSEDIMKNK